VTRVVVIGSGVIGLCTAFSLHQRGAEVVIVEKETGAHGASIVNAGWVTPALSDPVPSAGLVKTSLKWMMHGDSPLYIRPLSAPRMLPWLTSFWRHCNEKDFIVGMQATAELNRTTMALYDALKQAGVEFEEHRDGLLFAYKNATTMEHDLRSLEPLNAYGYPTPASLDGNAVRAFEPSLGASVTAGYWLEQERSVRPDSLTTGLRNWLEQQGVEFQTTSAVTGFSATEESVQRVITSTGAVVCDAAVICAGAWSGQLAAMAGAKLPVQGGKGYCLDYSPPPVAVGRPIYLHEARVAVTPFDGAVRLAGTMEFSGINDIQRPKRVAAISRTASTMLRDWPDGPGAATRTGSGLRPITPDGIPVLGFLPGYRNLAVATGHAMLGVTLGPATGDAIAETVLSGRAPDVLEPFSPVRFG
jgi:D-amino-acid dehydrogenase